MNAKALIPIALSALATVVCTPVRAQAVSGVSEDFTSATTNNLWYFFNGACLTASTASSTGNPGQPPGCTSIRSSYYGGENLVGGANGVPGTQDTMPDPVGRGALRFTNGSINGNTGGFNQNGAIFSKNTFPTGQGLQITFKTVTYRGNSRTDDPTWPEPTGADGIGFILADGAVAPNVGSWGGSFAYTCSNVNTPFDGMVGGYLGLGIDEFGNFLDGATLMPGYTGPNRPLGGIGVGDNTLLGYGYRPNRIGLRGAGSISWAWLHANFPTFYPLDRLDSELLRQGAVAKTCATGKLWNYGDRKRAIDNPIRVDNPIVRDYAPIPGAYRELPPTLLIARQFAKGGYRRSDATPIVYNLNLTQDGLLSFAFSMNGGAFQNVINKQDITAANGALPANFRFGFSGSTGGGVNVHEILCFKAQPLTLSSSSTGVNEKQSAKVEAGTQAYFSFYDPNPSGFTGRVTASDLRIDNATGDLFVAERANWDASCKLTGVAAGKTCPTTAEGPMAALAPNNRTLLTWNGTIGIPFRWTSLTGAQQTALNQGDSPQPLGQQRLDFLRGQRTNEISPAGVGLFRARNGVLADIISSSPTWVGPPQSGYPANWKDRLYAAASAPENAGPPYTQFITSRQTRQNVVYVGANDGFLHGFRSGAFDADGHFDTSRFANDGVEVLTYMPAAVLNTIHNAADPALDFSSTQYGHNYFVDGAPATGDLYYAGAWHTWLVSGLGAGGAALFALDVTDPTSTTFQESRASAIVMGEWTPGTLNCVNVSSCGANLGKTYGVPQIRRLHNGMWGVIFSNGIGSMSGDAGIYIMTVNPSNAAKTFYYLSTGRAGGNGIAYAGSADLDGDRITDYVYAGDLLGNVWRFDLTSNLPSSWAVTSGPLFTAPTGQPITTRPVIASGITSVGGQQVMVAFGTGQKTGFTNTAPASYASGTQTLYGVWDWNLTAWNAGGSTQYASLTPENTGLATPYTIKRDNLQPQIFTVAANGNRDMTVNARVCWQSSASCATGNDKFGWRIDLPGGSEQIVFNPQLLGGAFLVNSVVPANNSILSCNENTDTGFTYAVSVLSGGGFENFFPSRDDVKAAGVETGATGASFPVTTGDETWLVYQTVTNEHKTLQVNPPSNAKANRLTWIQPR